MIILRPLQCILGFLALAASIHVASGCVARAWVRAPDLVPNTIVQGDARVKISAECPTVDNVSLGLRFKERSFVKALLSREDVPRLKHRNTYWDFSNASPWPLLFVNQSAQKADEELLANRDLWAVREEERAVFETTQRFSIGIDSQGVLRDAVQNFTILVPSTNFPPTPQRTGVRSDSQEILEVEWIYEYFVQVSFSNGTTKDLSAGYTAFQPLHDPATAFRGPISATVGLIEPVREKHAESRLVANYSIEVIDESGLTYFAGTSQFVNAVVKRTGRARIFSEPLKVSPCISPSLSSKWAVEFDMPANPTHSMSIIFALRDKGAGSRMRRSHCSYKPITVMMPNSSSDEIQGNGIVTTTSATFKIPIELLDVHIADFETYYQTVTNALTINLRVPRAVDLDVDPDDPLGDQDAYYGARQFEDDEAAWVPWEKPTFLTYRAYSGRIPVVVYPADMVSPSQHCLPASVVTLEQAIFAEGASCKRLSLTHYLDEGARGPVFVDRDAVDALFTEAPQERASHAPTLNPTMSSVPEGEERVFRYYMANPRMPIFVGDTWAKKVAHKNKVTSTSASDVPVLQHV